MGNVGLSPKVTGNVGLSSKVTGNMFDLVGVLGTSMVLVDPGGVTGATPDMLDLTNGCLDAAVVFRDSDSAFSFLRASCSQWRHYLQQ